MKKIFLVLLLTVGLFSCSSDDDGYNSNEPNNDENVIVRLSSVNAITNEIELVNLGSSIVEVEDFYLCLGPGRYPRVGEIAEGSTNLAPNERVTLNYTMSEVSEGIGLFATNTFASSSPGVLLDYMQWGAANQARVNQAVTAGRWDNATSFIEGASPFIFTGNANDFGANFWDASVEESKVVRFIQVNTLTNEITLFNFGNVAVDIDDYFLCLGPGRYPRVGDIASGTTNLGPNESVTLLYEISEAAEGILLFNTNTFSSTDPEVLLDYIQWGAPDQIRVENAILAGRWDDASSFVSGPAPYDFNGNSTDIGANFWE